MKLLSDLINGIEQRDNRAIFCNAKWSEANGFAHDAWGCYMELGKELRELKEGELKGKFKDWCEQELDFSYQWANVLIRAYSRYEISKFTDEPPISIQAYAKNNDEEGKSTFLLEPETEENFMKPKTAKQSTAKKIASPFEAWAENENLDDLQKEILKVWYGLAKRIAKRDGSHAVEEAIELINTYRLIYKL